MADFCDSFVGLDCVGGGEARMLAWIVRSLSLLLLLLLKLLMMCVAFASMCLSHTHTLRYVYAITPFCHVSSCT